MDTVDKVEVKKRGRPKAQKQADATTSQPTTEEKDLVSPMGDYLLKEAKKATEKIKQKDPVVDKWWEVQGHKVRFCKRTKSGSVYREFVGLLTDKKTGKELQEWVKKKEAEGQVRYKV